MNKQVNRNSLWHSRGYLPHCNANNRVQFVTFRLADSLPGHVQESMQEELEGSSPESIKLLYQKKVFKWLDAGYGACILGKGEVAEIVQGAILYHANDKYVLLAWVIMPNHVHLLIAPKEKYRIEDIVRSLKSFTGSRINRLLGASGPVWYREYFDRYIRDEAHYKKVLSYIEENPVKAGLCRHASEWLFGSAYKGAGLETGGPLGLPVLRDG